MKLDFARHSHQLINKPYYNVKIEALVEKASERQHGAMKYQLSNIKVFNKNIEVHGKLMLYCKTCQNIPPHSIIRATATVVPLPQKVYPTAYNVEKKYVFLGFSGFAFTKKITILEEKPSQSLFTISTKMRQFFLHKIDEFYNKQLTTCVAPSNSDGSSPRTLSLMPSPSSGCGAPSPNNKNLQARAVVESIFLGEKSTLSSNQYDTFRKTGLSHIVAISGMHISIVMLIFYQVFFRVLATFPFARSWLNLRKICLFPALALSFAYLCVAGVPVSGLRSFLMITFATFVFSLNAKPKLFASVIFSGFVLLALFPHELFFASFQLSFLAVLYFSFVIDTLPKNMNLFLKYIITTAKSTILITLITAPVVIFHFGGISLIGPVANIVVIPLLTFFIMPIGIAFFFLTSIPFTFQFILPFAKITFACLIFFINLMLDYSSFLSNFDFSFIALKDITLMATLCILGGILTVFFIKSLLKFIGILFIIVGLGMFIFSQTPDIIANGESFAFRDNGHYYIIGEDDGFAQSIWKSKLGIKENFLDGKKFCQNGICISQKITFIQKEADVAKNPITQCTEILATLQQIEYSKLPCKYEVIITENTLKQGGYFALKYSQVNKKKV